MFASSPAERTTCSGDEPDETLRSAAPRRGCFLAQGSLEGRIAADPPRCDLVLMSTWSQLEADRAFKRASRARRRAAFVSCLRRGARLCGLAVFDETRRSGSASARGVREIPLDAIKGTTEPNRAAQFDHEFRPASLTKCRWQSVWLAFHRGATLPPISVVQVGDAYAIRDGHHRVSVAKALGVPSIRALVAA
jgi:hypothetical protein